MSAPLPAKVHVIGAGLVGTSIALKLRAMGVSVSVEDSSLQNQALARDLIQSSEVVTAPRVVFVAVSPLTTAETCARALSRFSDSIVVDVSSIKTKVVAEVLDLSDESRRFVPSHPIAGREVGGPESAQGDLFEGRPWIITPLEGNTPGDIEEVKALIEAMGAVPHRMEPADHDYLFARISHFPQILSTLLSGTLLSAGDGVTLSGQGLRDVTRLANSDPALWSQIIALNATEIKNVISDFQKLLRRLEVAVDSMDISSIVQLFKEGQEGRKLIGGKHGGVARDYSYFRIVIDDRPGVLGQLFALCGEHGVNVEDLDIEHTPNQETGLITIAVAPHQTDIFASALKEHEWRFHINGRQQ